MTPIQLPRAITGRASLAGRIEVLRHLLQRGHASYGVALISCTAGLYTGRHVTASLVVATAATAWWAVTTEP